MKTPTFTGEIQDGKLVIKHRNQFDLFVSSLEGKVEIQVKPYKSTRSDRQRRYYWAVIIPAICQATGYDLSEANEFLKWWFNPKIKTFKGQEIRFGSSIEAEKTDRVEEIYREIREWASAELHIFVPEPNEEDMY